MTDGAANYRDRTLGFLGIGGHACGSTKLYQLLKAHPEVGFVHKSGEPGVDIRGKECHYWDRYRNRPLEWYLSYFKWEYPCVGEITPAYARLDADTVRLIGALFPCTHVFFVIRETLARTWSNVRKNMVKQHVRNPTLDWMIAQADAPKTRSRNDYVTTVRAWHEAFRERFHVLLFDDLIGHPRDTMIKIASLLEIDTSFYVLAPDDFLRSRANPTTSLPMPKEFAEWFERHGGFQWDEQCRTIKQITPFL
jgi:hypothetical protein